MWDDDLHGVIMQQDPGRRSPVPSRDDVPRNGPIKLQQPTPPPILPSQHVFLKRKEHLSEMERGGVCMKGSLVGAMTRRIRRVLD